MNVKTGVFCISPVSGLDYETPSQRGRTNERGEFLYREGETVTFSVGELVLGSGTGKAEMTPADLSFEVAGNIRRITNRKVTNISRLLLSLNPADDVETGITITDAVRETVNAFRYRINLNAPEDFFTEDAGVQELMAALGSKLCSPACARNHLRRRMDGIIKHTDVKIPLRSGSFLYADVFRPVKEGRYPVIISSGGYGKAFWLGKIGSEEEFELHERMEDNYFEDRPAETDYINFHIQLAGGKPVPADAPGFPKPGSPVNAMLTHVSEYFERANTRDWVPYGYVVVNVDSAGLGRSPGMHCQFGRPEAEDYYDSIQWAAEQPWSNGNVGIYGGSFYAMNAFNVSSLQPPALKAMIPLAGDLDPYRDYSYVGGMCNKFGFVPRITVGEWQGYDMVEYVKEHPFDEPDAYNAEGKVAMKPDPANIKIPFWTAVPLEQGSIHTRGASEAFIHTATSRENKKLTIASEVGVHFWMYGEEILARHRAFFDHWLKGEKNGIMEDPPVDVMIRTGHGGYYWQREQEWPIARTQYKRLYLSAVSGSGADTHALAWEPPAVDGKITYSADVPVGEAPDSTFGARFVSPPMEEDTVIAGYSKLDLYVSSTSHDMAVLANLRVLDENDQVVPVVLDLNPAFPMAKGALKVSHRKQDLTRRTEYRPFHTHRQTDCMPLVSNQVVDCEVELFPATMRIRKGWKLLLEIQPNNSAEMIELHDDYRPGAENSVYTGGSTPSYLQIPVIG